MYPPRRMFRGPQEEHRTVSKETEVAIPNLEALSICIFSAVSTVGFLWWGRYWKLWFPPVLLSVGIFLVMLKKQITLPRLGLGIRDVLLRESKGRTRQWIWGQLKWGMNSIILPTLNKMTPPTTVAIASFFGIQEALKYWYSELDFGADILMGLTAGFIIGTAAVTYYHWCNIRDPAWPSPRWYVSGEDDKDEPPDYDDRSSYSRRNKSW